MRTKKRILSMLIAVCLIAGMLPVTAHAEGTYTVTLNSGTLSIDKTTVAQGEDFSATVTPKVGYALPSTITVKNSSNNGVYPSNEYFWNATGPGTISIPSNYIKGDITIEAEGVAGSFNVNFGGEGVTFNGDTGENAAAAGTDYTATLTAQSGYTLPDSDGIILVIGGNTLTSYMYTYEQNTGKLTIPGALINGIIEVIANGEAMTGQRVSVIPRDSTLSISPDTATSGENYTGTLTPAAGYSLPESINVDSGTTTLTSDSDFTYNKDTGAVTIKGASITGDIKINASGIANTYSVTFEGSHISFTGNDTAIAGGQYTATLTTGEGYTLPDSITVTVGGTQLPSTEYVYAPGVASGTFEFSGNAISGDIVIQADGVVRTYRVSFDGPNLSFNGTDTATGNRDYTATIVPEAGYELESITVKTGGTTLVSGQGFDYDEGTGKLTVYGPCIDDNIIINATVNQGIAVIFHGTNVSSNGKGVAYAGHAYTAKLTAAAGHKLPDSITVTIDGTEATNGEGYTYNSSTGELEITQIGSQDVVITAVDACVFNQETVSSEALKSAATCTTPATYYKSCACGTVSTSDTDIFTNGSVDSTNHAGGTEVRGKVEATTSAEGYTGDTYCLGCNTKIKTGTTIPKKDSGSTGGNTGGGDSGSDNSGGNTPPATDNGSATPTAPAYGIYTVQSGDSLWTIAKKYGCTVSGIVAANSGLIKDPDKIYPGWQLTIPQTGATGIDTTPDAILPDDRRTTLYIVKQGDTLWAISKKYGCTVSEIVVLNSKLIADPDLIFAGWELKISQD